MRRGGSVVALADANPHAKIKFRAGSQKVSLPSFADEIRGAGNVVVVVNFVVGIVGIAVVVIA